MAISKLEDSLSADLLNAASCIYNGNSNSHPIILINSLKNILGDVRSNPSNIILDFIRNHTNKLEDNRNDKIYLEKECGQLLVFHTTSVVSRRLMKVNF